MNNYHSKFRLLAAGLALTVACMTSGLATATGQGLLGDLAPAEKSAKPATDYAREDQIRERITALALEQKALALQLQQAGEAASAAAANKYLAGTAEKLGQVELLLKAQLDLATALSAPAKASQATSPPDKPSVYRLNNLYEQLAAAEAALREKRNNLDTAKEQVKSLETRAREAKATLADASEKDRERNTRAAALVTLNARIATEQVNFARLELRMARAEADQENSLEARITAMRASLARGEGDTDSGIAGMIAREGSLQRAKNRAEHQLTMAEMRLVAAKQQYAQNPQTSAELLLLVEALTAFRDAIGKQIGLATSELDRLGPVREIWSHWESLLRGAYTPDELAGWETLAKTQLSDLKLIVAQRQGQIADLQIRLESLEARINQLPPASPGRGALEETAATLRQLHTDLLGADRLLAADRRLTERFETDLATITGKTGFIDYIARAIQAARGLWNIEITTIDEAPFTIGSLTMGLLLFAVGLWASRLGATAMGRVAAQRLKLDAGAAQAMQTFSFYALLVGFTLLALRAVHFPLTAFTFLGGALAIGVGFGSQNVMNNFISGLILMLERPVRALDVVEVDGNHGVIMKIGPRSTHIRSTDGRHIVVPNSFFLESNVVNWTLSDDLMRTKVSVGVSYGSPTRLVKQLIEQVIHTEPLVLNQPPPNVIFDAFADNSLNFDVYFWVEARSPMSVREVQSRVRFAIDDIFREHQLVIAFPQRDVHLDSAAPLEVRLVDTAATANRSSSST